VEHDDGERRTRPRRPGVGRWLWYAVSGRLPDSYRDWVLYDLSCRTWPLRQLAKLLVPLVPVAAVLLAVLPGPLSLRATAVVLGSLIGLLYTFVFLNESTERRAQRFGYPPGAVRAAREERRASRDLARAAEEFDRTRRPRRFPG
jgi:Family of unknown function (DUF5313)